ncbi:carbohydrate ABC transporter permease [Paenibacillaceae bacterium WGS1546]|uniref:carbohydrate ABC transporter permease n=1 Tax=Cohnella sp. WGS1546 TaxID=3366810 RepID=UPI00372D0FFB
MRLRRLLFGNGNVVFEAFMILCSGIVLIPLMIMVLGSLKNSREASLFNLALPTEWRFDNYAYVFSMGGLGQAMGNSLIFTLITVLACSLLGSLCSFVLQRRNTRVSGAIYNLFIIGMVAPLSIFPTIGLLKALQLYGTYAGVILIYIGMLLPWSIFIFTSFLKGIPREMDEAAVIDGCGPYRMFFLTVLPLLQPVIAVNVVFLSMNVWNDFMIPLYFLNDPGMMPVTLTIFKFFGSYFRDWNYVFADLVIASSPIVLLYLYCQKYMIAGLTAGAVKG